MKTDPRWYMQHTAECKWSTCDGPCNCYVYHPETRNEQDRCIHGINVELQRMGRI